MQNSIIYLAPNLDNVNITYENNIDFNVTQQSNHMHIFRVLQELLSNSIRHGKATNISIRFDGGEASTCYYKDNGLGFSINDPETKRGLGLKNIESRINLLNGTLTINSEINKGTAVTFSF